MSAPAPARPRTGAAAAPARSTRVRTDAWPRAGAGAGPGARPRARSAQRPRLALVATAPVRSTTPFVVVVAGLLVLGLVALLLLHTVAAQDAFQVNSLSQQLATVTDTEQQLEVTNQLDQSPQRLAARAQELGMLPSVVSGYHREPDGRIVGTREAVLPPAPVAPPTTSASKHGTKKSSSQTAAAATHAAATDTTSTRRAAGKRHSATHHHAHSGG